MISFVIIILTFVLLVACWLVGDTEFRTKVILTGIYAASWLLAFVDAWALTGAQAFVSLILWWVTFGPTGR